MSKLKTHEEFLKDLSGRGLIPLERYRGNKVKIEYECVACSNIFSARPNDLLTGHGCPKCGIKKSSESQKRTNRIIGVSDGVLYLDVSAPKHPNEVAIFDSDTYFHLKRRGCGGFTPSQKKSSRTAYLKTTLGGKHVEVHRLMFPGTLCVDHINGNGLDNRLSNLRVVTYRQNQLNRRVNRNNTSGATGVVKRGKKFYVRVSEYGKGRNLGVFDTLEDAVKARKEHLQAAMP